MTAHVAVQNAYTYHMLLYYQPHHEKMQVQAVDMELMTTAAESLPLPVDT